MLPQTAQHVAKTRDRIRAYKTELEESIERFGENNDKNLFDQVEHAKWWLDEVETQYLAILDEERFPPLTVATEALILKAAVKRLNKVAGPQIKKIREWSVKYGPDFEFAVNA